MSNDLEEYKDIYINDMRDHLQNMNRSLVELEQDTGNNDLINEIFRAAHTIKGNSATMEYNEVAHLAHEMENLLDKIRNKEIDIDQPIMDVIFESFDVIESMIEAIAENKDIIEQKELIEKLVSVLDKTQTNGGVQKNGGIQKNDDKIGEIELSIDELRCASKAVESGENVYKITVTIDAGCGLKSAKATIVIRNLEKFGDKIAVYPPETTIKETNPGTFHVILASNADRDILKESALAVSEISDVEVKIFEGEKEDETEEFDLDSLDIEEVAQESVTPPVVQVTENTPLNKIPVNQAAAPTLTIQNIRVNIHQLDILMNHVGELLINKVGLEHTISKYDSPELAESVGHLSRIVEELQEDIMSIRMIPVDHIFSKYPRIIRDLSRSRGKKVKLVVEGGDIELDRTVLDGINDPLVHILRNSIDHGIEMPKERLAAGKSDEGIVKLKASREKNHVIIEISDDGAGINPDIVMKSALSKGVVSEDEAAAMSDDELVSLIFLPGFSTAATVSDISGRGVGMDVVKRDIEQLGGSIKTYSTPGEGTRLKLKLPLTLAIIKGLVVKVAGQIYVLPLNNVFESIKIHKDQIKMVDKKETCLIREKVIPLVRLSELFEAKSNLSDDNYFVVIVEHEERLVGLMVDELVGQQEVVIKSLGRSLGRLPGFAGATIIKSGTVALILDINSLLNTLL
ncbi:MAG: chemotaxis protein CheA [ANME-2 cluster archaeon]|nr:chemotaxis protein CheA [ANME-2 cluster archaeon]